jgi:hypothetical protein
MALASTGQYAEAMRVFEEARRLGREYRLDTLLARAICMSVGFHQDIFDFARAESLAQEARELARSANFSPPAVSAGIGSGRSVSRKHGRNLPWPGAHRKRRFAGPVRQSSKAVSEDV